MTGTGGGAIHGVSLAGLRKSFGPVQALVHADLHARSGEVHALLGENGAGKSTLMNILGGMLRPDGGEIRIGGERVEFRTPRQAQSHGVGMVHQHFTLVPALTVLENVALGLHWDPLGIRLPLNEVRSLLERIEDETGLKVPADARVEDLSVGARQRAEILRVLAADPEVLILDEPTAVLTPAEVETLFRVLRELAEGGRTVLLIAHKLDEVLAVGDRFTVLRGGETVLEAPRSDVTAGGLAGAMVGGEVDRAPVPEPPHPGEVVARLRGVAARSPAGGEALRQVDLEVRRGEIVGVAGVEGNGQRELARVLAGLDPPRSGSADLPGNPGWIPQDRAHEGLISTMDIAENTALALHLDRRYRGALGSLDWRGIRKASADLVSRFSVRTRGIRQRAGALSGGNQQKVVVGREFLRSRDLLIAENPTRGLDVAATSFVRGELLRIRTGGPDVPPPGIVLISTDLDEVLDLSDRLFVLLRGSLIPVSPRDRTREAVGALMLGTGVG